MQAFLLFDIRSLINETVEVLLLPLIPTSNQKNCENKVGSFCSGMQMTFYSCSNKHFSILTVVKFNCSLKCLFLLFGHIFVLHRAPSESVRLTELHFGFVKRKCIIDTNTSGTCSGD